MKRYIILSAIALSLTILNAADDLSTMLSDGKVSANVRYYYIETQKDKVNAPHTSAHSNAIGGQLSYTTADWNGLSVGATFMTTNGFALPNTVDTSTIGKDNGVREEGSAGGNKAQASFSILGEAFVNYKYDDIEFLYGRKVIKTPLIHAKDVRMIPSAVQGAFINYDLNDNSSLEVAYLTHFKQRTSDEFTNIIEHALGDKTKEVTGSNKGDLLFVDYKYKADAYEVNLYDYYAQDFINSIYLDASFSNTLLDSWKYKITGQYINQTSVGNADDNLADATSVTGGKKINSNSLAFKFNLKKSESSFNIAYSKVFKDSNKHDSLVTPYDGTPLLTNMITSNALFASNYGKGLTSDSVYIGGANGVKLGYAQTYGFLGLKEIKTSIAYLYINNSRFKDSEHDYNAVLAYTRNKFSLALKGIWVKYNATSSANGTINQDNKFIQYRVIANYKF